MLIAIDGPAGAGKSTVARAVANALGYAFLDSGAMYRAAALAGDVEADIRLEAGNRVFLGDREVTDAIRTPEVSEAASVLAADPDQRRVIVRRQRDMVGHGDWVIEGRDAATAIAPEADVKIFLTASVQERAKRRAEQTGQRESDLVAELIDRDTRDDTLGRSVMRPAMGAVAIDTTGLDLDRVIKKVLEAVTPERKS